MTKEEFINNWLSHIRKPNYPQSTIDLMHKELSDMLQHEANKIPSKIPIVNTIYRHTLRNKNHNNFVAYCYDCKEYISE